MSTPNDTSPLTCAAFEEALSEYREGTLPAARAAAVRQHLTQCRGCAALLAAVDAATSQLAALPQLEAPPRLLEAILSQTLAPRQRARRAPASGWGSLWAACTSPRFALAVAMSVFTVALLLNAAQVNLRQVSLRQLTPASLTSALQRQVDRAWARGVSYYHDLRVVYEIEAAIHQMRQAPAAPAPPAGGHDRSQGHSQALPDATVAALSLPAPLFRRVP